MDNRNLIITNEWSLEGNVLKVMKEESEARYLISEEVATCIHIGGSSRQYFVFDGAGIQCLCDAYTGLTYPFTRTSNGMLGLNKCESRKLHVRTQFTRFLFEEFLRNREKGC